MKKKYSLFFILLILHLVACQNDDFQIDFNAEKSIDANENLSQLIARATQNTTGRDNFIDQSSATKIEFPYQLRINNNEFIPLNSDEDYQEVINQLQELGNNYTIELKFPLEVSLVNYETLNVTSQENLEIITSAEQNQSEINCIEFIYPLQINSYALDNELAQTRTFSNKAQFYANLKALQNQNGFFEFSYPIQLIIENNSLSVSNRAQLEDAFLNLQASCFTPNLFEPLPIISQFEDFILNETFIISDFTEDGEDKTEDFENFEFTFQENNNLSIFNTQTEINYLGEWTISTDEDEIELILDFSNSIFEEIEEDWKLVEFENISFTLQDDNDFLAFEKK